MELQVALAGGVTAAVIASAISFWAGLYWNRMDFRNISCGSCRYNSKLKVKPKPFYPSTSFCYSDSRTSTISSMCLRRGSALN